MKNAKCFDSGVAGMSRDAALGTFVAQKALMMPVFQFQMSAVKAAKPGFTWSVFATPAETPEQRTLFARIDPLLSVNAKAKNEAAALAFVDFAMQPEQNAAYADALGVISTSQFADQKAPSYLDSLSEFLFRGEETTLFITPQYKTPSTYSVLLKNLVGLITGQVSVDKLLKELDDTYGK
jgi:raffinose/stachyose/melibiose transport system substrate-binding protein